MSKALQRNEAYIQSIQKVLTGELEYAKFNKDSILSAADEVVPQVNLSASKQEMELRKQVAEEDKNAVSNAAKRGSENPK